VLWPAKNSAPSSSAYAYSSGSSKSAKTVSIGHASDAGVAVEAEVGIDVQLLRRLEIGIPVLRMDAVDRAHFDARVVLDAAAGDDVRHAKKGYEPMSPAP
jgi:hypothetical protein